MGQAVIRGILALMLMGGIYAYQTGVFAERAKVEIFFDEDYLTATTEDSYFELDIQGKSQVSYRVVYSNAPQSSIRALGVARELTVLPDHEFGVYQDIVDNKECPAAFLNLHAVPLLLVPGGEKGSKVISKGFKEGEWVDLTGHPLDVSYVEYKGNEVYNFSMSKAELFLVTE